MKDKFEEFACEFKNESECEEELEDEGLTLEEAENSHFKENPDGFAEEDLNEDLE